jgi:thiamine-monophosphate kinase
VTREIALGPGGEFDLVRQMLAVWGETAVGVGSDCAEIAIPAGSHLVASTDSSVENVHFRRDWLSPQQIGWRAAAAALSDLSAAGAVPHAALIAINLPEAWLPQLSDLARGIGEAMRHAGAKIVGGDIARSGEMSITLTVLGHALRPLSREGSRIGDVLVVTGDLGRSAAALAALRSGSRPDSPAMDRFAHPLPRVREGQWLAGHGAHAAIDISDGLASELQHLAAAGNVRLRVDLELIPAANSISPLQALGSGEEYELLAAIPASLPLHEFTRETGTPLSAIGRVVEGEDGVELLHHGVRIAIPAGYSHF